MKKQPVKQNYNGISWTSKTTYVDANTGEIIEKKLALNKEKFTIIKTKKYETTFNNIRTRAEIHWITLVRRNNQTKLQLD